MKTLASFLRWLASHGDTLKKWADKLDSGGGPGEEGKK